MAAARLEPLVRREVGVDGDEPLLQRDEPGEVEEERLPRPVLTDHEPDGGAPVLRVLDIADERVELGAPPDLDVVEPRARDDAGAEGLDERLALAAADLGSVGGIRHR